MFVLRPIRELTFDVDLYVLYRRRTETWIVRYHCDEILQQHQQQQPGTFDSTINIGAAPTGGDRGQLPSQRSQDATSELNCPRAASLIRTLPPPVCKIWTCLALTANYRTKYDIYHVILRQNLTGSFRVFIYK